MKNLQHCSGVVANSKVFCGGHFRSWLGVFTGSILIFAAAYLFARRLDARSAEKLSVAPFSRSMLIHPSLSIAGAGCLD
jgi:hypothetical protein